MFDYSKINCSLWHAVGYLVCKLGIKSGNVYTIGNEIISINKWDKDMILIRGSTWHLVEELCNYNKPIAMKHNEIVFTVVLAQHSSIVINLIYIKQISAPEQSIGKFVFSNRWDLDYVKLLMKSNRYNANC